MNDSVYFIFGKNTCHSFLVGNIRFVKLDFLSCYFFTSVNDFGLAVAEIVRNDNVETAIEKFNTSVGTDIAGTAGKKNGNLFILFSI